MRVVIASGGFDPIHSGHIDYLNSAKKLGEYLIVGVNSDEWLSRKKGKPFMKWEERSLIVNNLKSVDSVIPFDDSDDSAIDLIMKLTRNAPPSMQFIFVNGGDRTKDNIPEMKAFPSGNIKFVFGVGGLDKKNSSSWLLKDWVESNGEYNEERI